MADVGRPVVLCVGGLDPSGGAGLLVDAAAVRMVGAHPAAVAASLTIQNGVGFLGASPQDPEAIARGMAAVLATGAVGAVKTGALGDGRVVRAVARVLDAAGRVPLVVDPVLASSSGGALLDGDGVEALLGLLVPRAALVTPNLDEAAVLAGFAVTDPEGMARAARGIGRLGARAVLVKGGHLAGTRLLDVLGTPSGEVSLEAERLPGGAVRGTGCALAAAAAAGLALGEPVERAVERARSVVRRAIGRAVRAGEGPRVLVFD
jgi:hydroxymethylpyrimidine/phosphomethylpyrimidine kinase